MADHQPLREFVESYQKWFDSLPDTSLEKVVQPLLHEAWLKSDIAKMLKNGWREEFKAYENAFKKDFTLNANNWWGNIRRDVKLDVISRQVTTPPGWIKNQNLPPVPGIGEEMFTRGVLHTVQTATMAGALAGSIISAQGSKEGIDKHAAMTITYAAAGLGDMVLETASKYTNPKNGGFVGYGIVDKDKWQETMKKYVGDNPRNIEAAGKMLAGAGTVVFAVNAFWKMANAIRDKDPIGATLQGINGAASTIQGLALGAEGVAQMNGLLLSSLRDSAKRIPGMALRTSQLMSAEAAARFALARVGWGAGLVAGLALTGLGIYDMAKGVKVFDETMEKAHDRWVRPLTGWNMWFEPSASQ